MTSLAPATIWMMIAGMAAANFILRFTPIAVFSRTHLPAPLLRWLSFVPISVMGALVALEVLRPGGAWRAPLTSPYVWAAAITALTFRLSRSFLGATIAGMASFVLLRWILGML